MSQDRTYKTRLAAAALILSVAAIVLAPVLVMPGVAKAQDAPAIIASDRERAIQKTVEDEKRTAREALDAEKQHREREIREGSQNLWDRLTHDIGVTMANVSASVMITMGQMMASNLAENAATWVATGSWGQQPLIYQTPWQAYMDGIVDQALGSFVYSIGSVFGINSCVAQVPLGFRLRLVNDLRNPFQTHPLPIIGQCRWTDIKKSWSDLADRVDKFGNPFDSERMLAYFQDSLSAGGTDINNQENLIFLSLGKIQRDAFEAQQYRERSDYRAVRDPAGNTRMTATRVEREAELTTANRQAVREDAYFAGLLANGAESIASVFTSTFINSLVFKLLNPEYSEAPQVQPEFTQFSSFINPYGEEIAKAAFSGLKTTRVIEVGQVDLLQEFTTCPDKYVGQNNCVIDSKFEAGIRLAQTGRSLTVAEAIDKGYLHGDWFLIPPTNVAKNADPSCRVEAYCHSNLKKMRKARILTIGWEMAAKISPVDAPDTLQKVVDAFGDCNSAGAADDAHPYCHLINPKWILKLPATQCRAKVFGPTLEAAESGNRKEYCADYRTCINEAPDGTCPSGTGGWGYCVREKNTWRINGDTCPPQFNTCTTFAKRTGEVNSFLLSTVNYSVCNDANKGCKKYLNAPNAAGSYDAVKSVYLNARAQSCPPTDAGCTDLQDVSGASQFLKIPPISLDCKGDDNDPVQCNAYASPCNADEVGCERYTPENDDPPVPGTYTPAERDSNGAILAWNNECDKSCVGYNAFIQNASLFDTATPTEYFVPSSATSCLAAYEGCDSFTNLDKTIGDNTEYYNALRRCEKPSPDIKHGTYYYWEGSDVSGYELKSIELRSVVSSIVPQNVTLTGVAGDALVSSSGSPPVYDTSVSAVLTGYMKACNQYTYTNRDNPLVTFDPDCRELFDGAGKVSYRLLAHTIIVSDQCVKLRKTLSDQATCGATGGVWSAGTGTCSYNALPSLSGACPAEANLCRGYRGNAAQITKSVFYDEFNTLGNWTGGVLSSESLAVGEGSLKLTAATAQTPVTLTPSSLYTLTFWAKGSGVLSVDLAATSADGAPVLKTFTPTASLGNDWKLYIMGPVDFGSSAAVNGTLKVSATNVKASPVFLDKVNLKASAGKIYIVKNSWKTPAVCDADPNDSLPGLALGCSAYKDRAGKEVDLTGFTSICREKAVGCQQFVNTYNYGDVVSKVFNKGDWEVFVPGDAIEFYVNDPKMKCPAASQGCSKLGVENSSGSVDDAYFIDNPDNYEGSGGILCKASEENCDSWGANNVTYYFKDPLGARCVYDDTIGWVVEGSITPCSPENILSDGKYGIWKNGDTAYTGLTGVCDSEQNGCTEFIDREDKTIDADGKRYYLLDNGKLDKKSCGTGVSLKEGCILFDDTRNLIKKFSSSFSYEDSNAQGGAKVTPVNLTDLKSASTLTVKTVVEGVETEAPVKFCIDILRDLNTYCAEDQAELTSTDPAVVALAEARLAINCDLDITSDAYFLKPELVSSYKPTQDACRAALGPSNLILKVQRDRACSKWLACQSSAPYFDPTTQIQRQACSSVDLCQRLNTA
ncbi:MAG: CBM-cenC protein, partial [Candidatus Magasanikbacteria bacterium]|nr:CBM-cenC protein [Candidatus Magasanikbacteria bacterium]